MAAPILITKLYIPPTRAELVQRSELIERLKDGLDKKLTLISAPAGFGKTTLVSHWVENLHNDREISDQPIPVAWLSLDEDDNDPVRFLTYFITALNQIKEFDADLGQGALSMLQSPQPPPANTVLIEPLSEREIEVLQLLAKGLTNQVIATRLVLSPHATKTHTRNIYSKLAVNNRTQAVEKARTLGVLPPI